MEIEVNEYVRTDRGIIAKVDEIRLGTNREKKIFQNVYELDNGMWTVIDYIIKHSKNIIDLIEVGDVISYRIDNISTTLETKGYIEGIVDIADNEMLQEIKENKDYCIKSILTREQFAQAEYKIKEDK